MFAKFYHDLSKEEIYYMGKYFSSQDFLKM